MATVLKQVMNCPLCLKTMTVPILQCTTGHSMCAKCIKAHRIEKCPKCSAVVSGIRNLQMEQMILNMPPTMGAPCGFAANGCKQVMVADKLDGHQAECKRRQFVCAGRIFAGWKCMWVGDFDDIFEHFNGNHESIYHYKEQFSIKVQLKEDACTINLVPFYNGEQLFWCKQKVDTKKKKVYWTFQYIGPKDEADKYYYEFEVSNGPVRKFKVTEICQNDVADISQIFEKEKCVAISFEAIRNFQKPNRELDVKFRIMQIKKRNDNSK